MQNIKIDVQCLSMLNVYKKVFNTLLSGGYRVRLKVTDSRSVPEGVRRFKSDPPHYYKGSFINGKIKFLKSFFYCII